MIRAYLKRAWRVGRAYYFATLLALFATMVILEALFTLLIATVNPQYIHGVNMPIGEAVAFVKAMLAMMLTGMITLFTSIISSVIVLGTIQADIQNGVFEMLFGNGMDDRELAKALYAVGASSIIPLYLVAEAIALAPLYVVASSTLSQLLESMLTTPLGLGLFTVGLGVYVGLSKPKYFKISTGLGSTKNLAFTIVSLPSLIVLLVTVVVLPPLITPSSTTYPTAFMWWVNASLTIASIAMAIASIPIALRAPVNRVGLITRGEEA